MDDAKWERAAGAGGILFVVMVVISAFLPGTPPMTSDPAKDIAKWFVDNDDAIRYSAMLGILATLPLVWWGAALYRMLERATGNARLGVMVAIGIAIATAAAAVSSVTYATVAIVGVPGAGGLAGTRFFYLLGTNINSMVGIGTALAVGAASAGILRSGMMPKWIGWWGGLVVVLSVAASFVAMSTRDAVMTAMILSAVTFGVWIIAVSVVMLRKPAPA
jgi:hypothetical protein